MAMFDPVYVTKVLNDILGRRGREVLLVSAPAPQVDLKETDRPSKADSRNG